METTTTTTTKVKSKKLIPIHQENSAKNAIFFPAILGGLQAIFIVLLALHAEYGRESWAGTHPYSIFQDIHVMIFIGFGFLVTFFRRYG
jgi:hypothetical protein